MKYGVVGSIKVEVEIRIWVIDGYGFKLASRIWVFMKDTFEVSFTLRLGLGVVCT